MIIHISRLPKEHGVDLVLFIFYFKEKLVKTSFLSVISWSQMGHISGQHSMDSFWVTPYLDPSLWGVVAPLGERFPVLGEQ